MKEAGRKGKEGRNERERREREREREVNLPSPSREYQWIVPLSLVTTRALESERNFME